MENVALQSVSSNFTAAQLDMLKVMARPISDEDLRNIKKLIVRYFADKLSDRADEIWDKNGWTSEDEDRVLATGVY